MTTGERIKGSRMAKNISVDELAEVIGKNRATVYRYENGYIDDIPISIIKAIAQALGVSATYLMGITDDPSPIVALPDGAIARASMDAIPVIGEIACGTPILAEQNIDGYISIAPGIACDFALLCKGDSMEPRFYDGDYVLIRQQADVNDGQIAAVYIDGDATLKHVQHLPGGVLLIPENTEKYKAQSYIGADAENIRIMGRAVGYQRAL